MPLIFFKGKLGIFIFINFPFFIPFFKTCLTIFLIQGLEDELEGKTVGDKFVIDIAPNLAYGERHEELVQAVPKSMFEDMEVEPGMTFRATTDDGEQSVMIIDVTDDDVIVDGNHPLSGLTLNFDVEVLEVREATEEEIAHGHPHTEGGCEHTTH